MQRRRRRREAGRRSWGEAEGAPPVGRARGRLRGAGAGARAGSRGGYDDPAAGPRISSPPPPPHCSPSSRLRTRHTGGESRRGGQWPWQGAISHRLPAAGPGRPRALRGARPAGGASLSGPHPGPGAEPCDPAGDGRGEDSVPRKVGRLRACFRGNSPVSCHFSPGRVVVLR